MKNILKNRESGKSADRYAQNSSRREKSGNGRLSKQLPYDLAKKIPVRALMENELGIRHHADAGIFNFECPSRGFHTSIKKTRISSAVSSAKSISIPSACEIGY